MTPYHSDPWLTVWQGDCREVMAQMEPESVHCVVTSPPYWGLRDYGTATWLGGDENCDHNPSTQPQTRDELPPSLIARTTPNGDGPLFTKARANPSRLCRKCGAVRQDSQLGLEPTPEEYVANMVAVFREVRRVLRKDGTCWVNLGDSYNSAASNNWQSAKTARRSEERDGNPHPRQKLIPGMKPKDLVGIPWRVAFALQADGWYLRSDIIWAKPNPMPESVTDRPTKAHEYLFLLSKSARYFYDADAVREAAEYGRREMPRFISGAENGDGHRSHGDGGVTGKHPETGRNLRSVWSIATQPYPGAHFATFPEALVEPCVKAGTSERGVCPECGAPWRRVVERELLPVQRTFTSRAPDDGFVKKPMGHIPAQQSVTTTGWQPSCARDIPPVPAVVLDPFAGSGTTGRVAQRLGRRAVLIDLNGEYLTQAMKRNADIPLGLVAQ